MNIAGLLQRQAECRGGETAIVDAGRSLTFRELHDEAGSAASALADAGLRANDRVLVFCPMSADLYVTLIAIFRIGAVAVFLDPSAGRRQISACCDRLEPRGFVAVRRAHLLRLISRPVRRIAVKLAIGGGVPGTPAVVERPPRAVHGGFNAIESREPDSPALITFTSGSTGGPKAAVRSHRFLIEQHRVLAEDLELAAGEIDLATLPVFVLANLASGLTSVLADGDLRAPATIDPAALVRQIRAARPRRTAASPALLDRLARHLVATGDRLDLGHIFTGGAPVFPALLDRLAAVAPSAAITAVYGSTEAEPIAMLRAADISVEDRAEMRRGSGLLAGTPVASIALRIVPDRWGLPLGPFDEPAFDRLALSAGEAGEIVVAGPHVLTGYLDGCGDEHTKIQVGDQVWHRTGDAGYIDASGRLWLLGRCGARIRDARGTVYPFAVECAVSDIAGVRRTAFVEHRGRRLLVAELDTPAPSTAVEALRRESAWAGPDDVVVVDRIPVDARHNAKVDYVGLRKLLARITASRRPTALGPVFARCARHRRVPAHR